jgi:hypothetical protein
VFRNKQPSETSDLKKHFIHKNSTNIFKPKDTGSYLTLVEPVDLSAATECITVFSGVCVAQS